MSKAIDIDGLRQFKTKQDTFNEGKFIFFVVKKNWIRMSCVYKTKFPGLKIEDSKPAGYKKS